MNTLPGQADAAHTELARALVAAQAIMRDGPDGARNGFQSNGCEISLDDVRAMLASWTAVLAWVALAPAME